MKLSIIIPVYNTAQYLRKCLNSVIKQTYKNLEIILVNDCSTDNSMKIIEEYINKDSRIKVITHDKNKGLFQARLTGAKEATGDYIAFLDSDDYVSIDYYRTLIYSAIENNSDMVIGNTVLEYDDGRKIIYNLFDMNFEILEGDECIEEYFKQEGLCFAWHTIWNKIYSKKIWNKAREHYLEIKEHLVMTEDFAFSTVLYYYTKKISRAKNDAIFYCKHEKTSTDVKSISLNKFKKNVSDLIISFGFVENFMKKVDIYEKYKTNFERWKNLYKNQQISYLNMAKFNKQDRMSILEELDIFCKNNEKILDAEYFSSIQTKWNNQLEKIKVAIADEKIKCISFDIFDTLILRPFLEPSDLFLLLDGYFKEISESVTGINFSKIRMACENIARVELTKKKDKSTQEITIDDIYMIINEKYRINKEILEKMKQKEIEYELKFCSIRNTGYELYQMALAMGKKVICISDMYLSKDVINMILQKNGYNEIEKIFVSSECGVTKVTGDLYKLVCRSLDFKPKEILHIGDNFYPDVEMAKKVGLNAMHLKKTKDVFYENGLADVFLKDLPDWQDNKSAMNFLGIRSMMEVVANKYFDNPYRPFNKESIFNGDPYLIGYYGLGMHLYGVANWLIKDTIAKKYDSIVFMARDGYMPLKAYSLLKKVYNNAPKESYLYVSRKALIPASIIDEIDLYKLSEVINIINYTPKKVLKYISGSLDSSKDVEEILLKHGIKLDEKFKNIVDFNEFMHIVGEELFDQKKNKENLEKIKKYFREYFKGKSCTFDVGYSARPEMYISKLLDINLDTYFININHEEAFEHAKIGNFKLNTFFNYKPTFTGNVRELILSNTAPSCIGYNTEGERAVPIFEDSMYDYKEYTVINNIQNAALEFVNDIVTIFDKDIERLNYQEYYISLPHEMYLQSPTDIDKQVLNCIYFEDDLRTNEHVGVVEFWNNEIKYHNQHEINKLLNMEHYQYDDIRTHDEKIEEAKYLILKDRSRPIKLIYYCFFDRVTLRRRFSEIFGRYKFIMVPTKKIYKALKKVKNKINTKKN